MASNENWLKRILEAVGKRAPAHAAKAMRLLPLADERYLEEADHFFGKWFFRPGAWPVKEAVDAYVRLLDEMNRLQADYARTQRYPHTSFREVDESVYSDPVRMRDHLEALALAQFLWIDQWERFAFFADWISRRVASHHLEIGPGHGLYLERTARALQGRNCRITALDVSDSSLETARSIAGGGIEFLAADFLEWAASRRFDSITAGEVLEHVEEPDAFLKKLRSCLQSDGEVFLSTPLHAPMPDHITAFGNIEELRQLIRSAGFFICSDHLCAVDRLPLELAQRFLKPIMYCAILQAD